MRNLLLAFILLALFSCESELTLVYTCINNERSVKPNDYNDTGTKIFIPTAFTPNGDGLNDFFKAFGDGVTYSSLTIKSNGRKLFETTDVATGWDGNDGDGEKCRDGVYKYVICAENEADGELLIKGKVSLVSESINLSCDCQFEDQIDPSVGFVNPSSEGCSP